VFLRPRDICRFERESLSALKYYYYRVCVWKKYTNTNHTNHK
jgi:hypothetical protein